MYTLWNLSMAYDSKYPPRKRRHGGCTATQKRPSSGMVRQANDSWRCNMWMHSPNKPGNRTPRRCTRQWASHKRRGGGQKKRGVPSSWPRGGYPVQRGPHSKRGYGRANTQIPQDGLLQAQYAEGGSRPPQGLTTALGGDGGYKRSGKSWQKTIILGGGTGSTRIGQNILRGLRVWHCEVPAESGQGNHSGAGHMLGTDHGRHTGWGRHRQAADSGTSDHGGV